MYKMPLFYYGIHIKIIDVTFYIASLMQIFEIWYLSFAYSMHQFVCSTFLVLKCHTSLVATVLESTAVEAPAG